MDLIRHEKESPFYLAKWTEVWYYLSSRDLLLMLKIFGEHNGEVSSFLLTALIIVVGWNCAGKYYELPDNLQRFLCNILYVSSSKGATTVQTNQRAAFRSRGTNGPISVQQKVMWPVNQIFMKWRHRGHDIIGVWSWHHRGVVMTS